MAPCSGLPAVLFAARANSLNLPRYSTLSLFQPPALGLQAPRISSMASAPNALMHRTDLLDRKVPLVDPAVACGRAHEVVGPHLLHVVWQSRSGPVGVAVVGLPTAKLAGLDVITRPASLRLASHASNCARVN